MTRDRVPVLTDHTRLLMSQDCELDAVQCHNTDLLTAVEDLPFTFVDTKPPQQTRERTALDAMQGELSIFSAPVSLFAVATSRQATRTPVVCSSLVMASAQSTPASTTASVPSFGSTSSSGSKTRASTSGTSAAKGTHTVQSASAYAASQLFGEMPTLRACSKTDASALHYYQEDAFVPDGNGSTTEQNNSVPPQPYGLNNLNCRIVLQTDGTNPGHPRPIQHPFVTNFSEQNIDEKPPVFDVYSDETEDCSSVFSDVFAGTNQKPTSLPYSEPGSDTHVDGKASEDQTRLPVFDVFDDTKDDCSNAGVYGSADTPEPLFSNVFSDAFAGNSKQQLSEEKQPMFSVDDVRPAGDSNESVVFDTGPEQQQHDDKKALLSVQQLKAPPRNMLMSGMTRNLWDPGASSKFGTSILQLREPNRNARLIPELRTEWDPGGSKIHDLLPVAADAAKLQCRQVHKHYAVLGSIGTEVKAAALTQKWQSQVLIQFQQLQMASLALRELQGHSLCQPYCSLEVKHALENELQILYSSLGVDNIFAGGSIYKEIVPSAMPNEQMSELPPPMQVLNYVPPANNACNEKDQQKSETLAQHFRKAHDSTVNTKAADFPYMHAPVLLAVQFDTRRAKILLSAILQWTIVYAAAIRTTLRILIVCCILISSITFFSRCC